MPRPAKYTNGETDVLLAVWIKAFKDGRVILNFPTEAQCNTVKFKLYNAAKRYRDLPVETSELVAAIHHCEINMPGDLTVIIQHRGKNPVLADIAGQIGLDPENVPVQELPARRSAASSYPAPPPIPDAVPSMEFLQAIVPRPANPFFNRDEG